MFRAEPVPSLAKLEVFQGKVLKIFHAPYATPQDLGVNFKDLNCLIVLDPVSFEVAIVGTAYAGEIKKSAFTMANYLLPSAGILPMHSSANCLADGSGASVLFGLS
jgi:phosphoenolpyruvate carboxykinase (ATP)